MKKALFIIFITFFIGVMGIFAYLGLSGREQVQNNGEQKKGISFREFLPFGQKKEPLPNNTNNSITTTTPQEQKPSNQTPVIIPKTRKISAGPSAGITSVERPRSDAENPTKVVIEQAIRTVNKTNGHIVDIFADNGFENLVSARIIPKIQEAIFGPNGGNVVLRYLSEDLETTESFAGTISVGADSENALKGSFLPTNLISISVDKQNGKIFYLQNFDGNASGSFADSDGGNKKSIFNHSFSEWSTNFITPTKILFWTKPSGTTAGYAYIFNSQNSVFEKLIGGINGLTILPSKSGEKFLIGEGNQETLRMFWLNQASQTNNSISLKTLPEKCVWSKNENDIYCAVPKIINKAVYPDFWYQGQVSFNDDLIFLRLNTGEIKTLESPAENVDAINLTLSSDEKFLYFINKKDNSIWVSEI